MELTKKLKDEIWEYCRLNDIPNINEFVIKMVTNGFTSEKYGSTPWEKPIEVKEVQVEVIKEVEVTVDKIVEVIKEVIVEKEVFVTDNEANKILQNELTEVKETLKSSISDFEIATDIRLSQLNILDEKLDEFRRDLDEKDKELDNLREELEVEKNKPKQEDDDIYGGKKGYFGSNTSDLWNNKKKD
tara:strand:+ start:37828 stop:38388 length:561 start_codon:yes stop_codon:yes gene_type:complete